MDRTAPSDLDLLRRDRALGQLGPDDFARLTAVLDQSVLAADTEIVHAGDTSADMYFVLEGEATVERRGLALRPLGPGDHFGELALLGLPTRSATVVARRPVRLARLGHDHYLALKRDHPGTALAFVEALARTVAHEWLAMTDRVGLLLGERLLPRRAEVVVTFDGQRRAVAIGTRVAELLPTELDAQPVVAALLDGRPVSLGTPLGADAWLAPIGLGSWDGREVFRRSAGLLVLAAAARVHPEWTVRLAPALACSQPIELLDGPGSAEDFVRAIRPTLRRLVEEHTPFSEEIWTVEEARAELGARGWHDAAALLDTWRDGAVTLVRCGGVHAIRTGPVVPHAGVLEGVDLLAHQAGAILAFGARCGHGQDAAPDARAELEIEASTPRYGGAMVKEAARWQQGLGITSVGALNRTAVGGRVDEIIRVAEGFHEKRIGQVADAISARAEAVRVITIAGPSSSGKTTFIKRLITQLEIAGLTPHAVSLDDYYLDRDRSPRDASGELDFEALDALDLVALERDVRALLAGERVTPPRFDFKQGLSLPGAGHALALGQADVLLLEGIHGLNPGLFGDAVPEAQIFRVFIHPASSLPLDRLSRVAPEDVRLLRRIVRDRHGRAISAADNIARWPSVRRGELVHIYPFLSHADVIFDSSLVYELSVLKVYAERYLLEVPPRHPSNTVAQRLRQLADRFVAIYPDHVPPTSLLREFIGGSGFEY